jgi:hypothetical protein
MKASPKKTREILKGIPHVPFEEFTLKKLDLLVNQLEKTKPKESKVEVSPMEDSHHAPCMQEMTAIMVHDIDQGTEKPHIYALYQFCPNCEIAIRVL